jgi:hypothetical protein
MELKVVSVSLVVEATSGQNIIPKGMGQQQQQQQQQWCKSNARRYSCCEGSASGGLSGKIGSAIVGTLHALLHLVL